MYYLYFNLNLAHDQRMYQTFVFATLQETKKFAEYLKMKFIGCELTCNYKTCKTISIEKE